MPPALASSRWWIVPLLSHIPVYRSTSVPPHRFLGCGWGPHIRIIPDENEDHCQIAQVATLFLIRPARGAMRVTRVTRKSRYLISGSFGLFHHSTENRLFSIGSYPLLLSWGSMTSSYRPRPMLGTIAPPPPPPIGAAPDGTASVIWGGGKRVRIQKSSVLIP